MHVDVTLDEVCELDRYLDYAFSTLLSNFRDWLKQRCVIKREMDVRIKS